MQDDLSHNLPEILTQIPQPSYSSILCSYHHKLHSIKHKLQEIESEEVEVVVLQGLEEMGRRVRLEFGVGVGRARMGGWGRGLGDGSGVGNVGRGCWE
jgi:hypothetical protein